MQDIIDGLRQDVSYAWRMVKRSPGFTFFATLTIALGLGANAAIFSLVDGVLLKSMSYPEPERIVQLWEKLSTHRSQGLTAKPDRGSGHSETFIEAHHRPLPRALSARTSAAGELRRVSGAEPCLSGRSSAEQSALGVSAESRPRCYELPEQLRCCIPFFLGQIAVANEYSRTRSEPRWRSPTTRPSASTRAVARRP